MHKCAGIIEMIRNNTRVMDEAHIRWINNNNTRLTAKINASEGTDEEWKDRIKRLPLAQEGKRRIEWERDTRLKNIQV